MHPIDWKAPEGHSTLLPPDADRGGIGFELGLEEGAEWSCPLGWTSSPLHWFTLHNFNWVLSWLINLQFWADLIPTTVLSKERSLAYSVTSDLLSVMTDRCERQKVMKSEQGVDKRPRILCYSKYSNT